MHIETPRLILRHFHESDLEDLHAILSDAETMRFSEPPYDIDRTREFLRTFCIGKKGALAAELRDTGRAIGYILFHACEQPDEREIGWFFNRAYWGLGYAHEACDALIRHAFSRMGIRRIFAETTDPVRSVGLMKKLGMRSDGIENTDGTDMFLYSIHQNEAVLRGAPEDIDAWMTLVRRLRNNFPGLETGAALADHRATVLRFMADGRALCIKSGSAIAGVLLFSRTHNMICCLGVAPEFRRQGIAARLLAAAIAQLDRTRDISVTTFRAEDPLSPAPRALYERFGFLPGRLVEEFGYPNQEFVLPAQNPPAEP